MLHTPNAPNKFPCLFGANCWKGLDNHERLVMKFAPFREPCVPGCELK